MCAANQAGQVSRSSSAWATSRDSILVVKSILQIPLPGFLRLGCYCTCFNCFHVAVVTTCYDLLWCNAYALCLMRCVNKAPTVWQTEETPAAAGQLSPQQSTVEHSGAQWSTTKLHCNRIGIALESQLHVKAEAGTQHLLRPACLPRLGKRTSVYIHNTSAAFQHICFQECIFALVLEGSLNFGWEKHT